MVHRAWLVAGLVLLACGDKGPGSDGGTGGGGGGTGGGVGGSGGGNGGGGGGGGGTVAGAVSVGGRVSLQSTRGTAPSPESGATVRAGFDANANGTLEASETASATTDGEGRYTLTLGLPATVRVVVSFATSDAVTQYQTVTAAPGTSVLVNATLRGREDITCSGGRCALADDSLSLRGLPDGTTGGARVFNPVTEPDAFPGDFADRDGNLLLSGVFAAVELTSSGGAPVHTLAQPATLRLRLPRDTWAIVTDITPGDAQISVPLYAFDEVAGTWVRDGAGRLEDATGAVIAPTALDGIRNGSFAGTVYVVGQVNHFSYWNVDWPVGTHGCVRGELVLPDGGPASGAAVSGAPLTYAGTLPRITAGADGRFCFDAMRAEAAGEDLDRDGVAGEAHGVALNAQYAGERYDLGSKTMLSTAGTCSTTCADLGRVALTADRRRTPQRCTVSGQVRDIQDRPLTGALVYLFDSDVDDAELMNLCFDDAGTNFLCTVSATTDRDGGYRVTNVVFISPSLFAQKHYVESAQVVSDQFATRTLDGCPRSPVDLRLNDGFRSVNGTLQVDAGVLRWTPGTYAAVTLSVQSAQGSMRWGIVSEGAGVLPPVTYGVAPAGTTQYFPDDGGVSPLQSGDVVDIYLHGTSPDGLPYAGSVHGTVP